MYRFVFIKAEESWIKNFVPVIGLGGGMALPVVTYNESITSEFDFSLVGLVGIDVFLARTLFMRLDTEWTTIPQKNTWLHTLSFGVSLALSF